MTEKRSIVFMFLSAVFFSLGGVLIKIIPWSPITINGIRNIFGFMVIYIYYNRKGHQLKLNKNIFFGAIAYAITQIALVFAVKLTSAANAIVIQFTAPIFIILFSWLFFHKRPNKIDVITCAIVFAGIICFFLDGLSMGQNVGNLLALLSGISYAFVFMLKSVSKDTISPILWGQIICIITGAPFIFWETQFTHTAWLGIIALGIVQVGLAFICFLKGIEHCTAIASSLISTIEPIINPIWVAIFYGEKITALSVLGGTIVILAIAIYNIIKAKQSMLIARNK